MDVKDNNYDGEQQILNVLAERGKFVPAAEMDRKFDTLRAYAEEDLFDADAVPLSELKRKAGARTSWYWLPTGGLEHLIKTCVARKIWKEEAGLIYRKFARVTSVTARVEPVGDPHARGTYILTLTSEEADTIYVSEKGVPDPSSSERASGRQFETGTTDVWFLAVDSTKKADTGPAYHWQAPIDVKPSLTSSSSGLKLNVTVMPRAAKVLATFDSGSPKSGQEIGSETKVPPKTEMIRLVGHIGERFGSEISIALKQGDKGGGTKPRPELQDDMPVAVNCLVTSKSTPQAYEIIEALKAAPGAMAKGGRIEVNGSLEQDFLTLTFGDTIALGSEVLDPVVKLLAGKAGTLDPSVSVQLHSFRFATGRDFKNFADKFAIDFEKAEWSQGSDI
jgi:hypothetical protein